VVEDIEDFIVGGVSMKLYSPEMSDFDEYYFRLRPDTNTRNPWFREFWQERFKCFIEGEDRDPRYNMKCSGEWSRDLRAVTSQQQCNKIDIHAM